MADLTDRTLVNVSSWLACVTGDLLSLRILCSTLSYRIIALCDVFGVVG